ncbi:hypothetical protein EV715DRAFT_250704 [Schizophyllum commune]
MVNTLPHGFPLLACYSATLPSLAIALSKAKELNGKPLGGSPVSVKLPHPSPRIIVENVPRSITAVQVAAFVGVPDVTRLRHGFTAMQAEDATQPTDDYVKLVTKRARYYLHGRAFHWDRRTVTFQYKLSRQQWDALADSRNACMMRFKSSPTSSVSAVGHLKTIVARMPAGLPDSFSAIARSRKGVLLVHDKFNPLARAHITKHLDRILSVATYIRLQPAVVPYFLREGLAGLREELGARCVIIVPGGDAVKLAVQRHVEEAAKDRAAATTLDTTCSVCYTEASVPFRFDCTHVYCSGCVKHLLTSAVENKAFPLVCVGNEAKCGVLIPLSTTMDRRKPNQWRYCPTVACEQIYAATGDVEGTFACPSCFVTICTSCHEESHPGKTCAQHARETQEARRKKEDKLNQALIDQKHYKRCPNCQILVEKMVGCNRIVCRCGVNFCWRCVKHMREAHGNIGMGEDVPAEAVPVRVNAAEMEEQRVLLEQFRAQRDQARAPAQQQAPVQQAPAPVRQQQQAPPAQAQQPVPAQQQAQRQPAPPRAQAQAQVAQPAQAPAQPQARPAPAPAPAQPRAQPAPAPAQPRPAQQQAVPAPAPAQPPAQPHPIQPQARPAPAPAQPQPQPHPAQPRAAPAPAPAQPQAQPARAPAQLVQAAAAAVPARPPAQAAQAPAQPRAQQVQPPAQAPAQPQARPAQAPAQPQAQPRQPVQQQAPPPPAPAVQPQARQQAPPAPPAPAQPQAQPRQPAAPHAQPAQAPAQAQAPPIQPRVQPRAPAPQQQPVPPRQPTPPQQPAPPQQPIPAQQPVRPPQPAPQQPVPLPKAAPQPQPAPQQQPIQAQRPIPAPQPAPQQQPAPPQQPVRPPQPVRPAQPVPQQQHAPPQQPAQPQQPARPPQPAPQQQPAPPQRPAPDAPAAAAANVADPPAPRPDADRIQLRELTVAQIVQLRRLLLDREQELAPDPIPGTRQDPHVSVRAFVISPPGQQVVDARRQLLVRVRPVQRFVERRYQDAAVQTEEVDAVPARVARVDAAVDATAAPQAQRAEVERGIDNEDAAAGVKAEPVEEEAVDGEAFRDARKDTEAAEQHVGAVGPGRGFAKEAATAHDVAREAVQGNKAEEEDGKDKVDEQEKDDEDEEDEEELYWGVQGFLHAKPRPTRRVYREQPIDDDDDLGGPGYGCMVM